MADFQSSKTAAEIEDVLTGALLYTKAQPLTEGQKAFVRNKIGATELGEGIKIVSHFDSLRELEAAVPNPKAGDAYSIGTELPYNLYVYDFAHATWVNHGAIRANDIAARFAQNKAVTISAWKEDTDVFADYTYKAAIPIAEVTGNDFPIVAFSPADAAGGNFCPICFAFDGYVEIWAKAIPAADIVIPAITFIVEDTQDGENGNSTKGITNASGGIASESIGTKQIANSAVTREKLAPDALYSPVIDNTSSAYALTTNALGKTIFSRGSGECVITMSKSVSNALPVGAEFAVFYYDGSSLKIEIEGARLALTGESGMLGSVNTTIGVRISEKYGMVALKKLYPQVQYGDIWSITGNVEVVE